MDDQDRETGALVRESKEADRLYKCLTARIDEHAEELLRLSIALRESPRGIKFAPDRNTRGLTASTATVHYEDVLSTSAIKETLKQLHEASKEKAHLDQRKREHELP